MRLVRLVAVFASLLSVAAIAPAQQSATRVNPNVRVTGPNTRITTTITPPPSGPLHVAIIDRGYSEVAPDGSRTLTLAGCLEDSAGHPGGAPAAMSYSMQIPGGTKSGAMGPMLAPPAKPLGINVATGQTTVHTKSIGDMSHCRSVKMSFPPCDIQPGEYPLTITAQAVAGGPTLAASDKTLFGPNPSSVTLDASGAWEVGVPRAVSGHVKMMCGPAAGAEVQVYAPNAAHPVVATAIGAGDFTTEPLMFARAGSDTLRAAVGSSDRMAFSETSAGVSVARGVAQITALNEPKLVKLGAPTSLSVRVDFAKTGAPWAGVPVNVALYATSCTGQTNAAGIIVCSVTLDKNKMAGFIGKTVGLTAGVPVAAANPVLVGASPVLVASPEGLIARTIAGIWVTPIVDGSRPAGVMLNNYNRKWSGTGAHLNDASILYPGPQLKNGQSFDIKTLNSGPFSYYVDRVFLRTGDIQYAAPARIKLPLTITGGDDGGRRIKGFCFTAYCRYTIGADDSAPDIDNIALNDSYVSIDFSVVNGKVQAALGPTAVSLDFSCGGVTSLVCGLIRSYVNSKAHEQLDKLYASPALLGQLGASVDASIKKLLPAQGLSTLTSIAFADDGSLTLTGAPIVK